MKSHYMNIILLIGFALSCFGCQESPRPGVLNGSVGALHEPAQMAYYLRAEPAVKAAQTWKNSYGPGLTIQTKNYTVYTTLLEPLMLRQLPAYLESAHKA